MGAYCLLAHHCDELISWANLSPLGHAVSEFQQRRGGCRDALSGPLHVLELFHIQSSPARVSRVVPIYMPQFVYATYMPIPSCMVYPIPAMHIPVPMEVYLIISPFLALISPARCTVTVDTISVCLKTFKKKTCYTFNIGIYTNTYSIGVTLIVTMYNQV